MHTYNLIDSACGFQSLSCDCQHDSCLTYCSDGMSVLLRGFTSPSKRQTSPVCANEIDTLWRLPDGNRAQSSCP